MGTVIASTGNTLADGVRATHAWRGADFPAARGLYWRALPMRALSASDVERGGSDLLARPAICRSGAHLRLEV